MHSALASLGIVYAVGGVSDATRDWGLIAQDEEIEGIYVQMEEEFGMVTYEAWLALLVSQPLLTG